MSLGVLVVAPHPDDGELGAGGLLAKAKADGLTTGILDLSLGEMGTKGSVEQRLAEAQAASRVLGLDYRSNLRLPDGALEASMPQALALAQTLRQLQPTLVVGPWHADRHPDHTGAYALVKRAVHLAGLAKAPLEGVAHKVGRLLFFPGNFPVQPQLLVDISSHIETWQAAVLAHHSQFFGPAASATVSQEGVEARRALRRYWGNVLGVAYAEPLLSELPLLANPW